MLLRITTIAGKVDNDVISIRITTLPAPSIYGDMVDDVTNVVVDCIYDGVDDSVPCGKNRWCRQ